MRTLHEGDIITGEYSARYGGYCAQTGHSISIGPPMTGWKDLYDAGVEALYAAVEKLRPGYKIMEARSAGAEVFRKAKIYGRPARHLMGIQVERIGPNEPLQTGMTVTRHSWPYSRDNTKGHFIGDTWQVTVGAPRKLNNFPEQFVVV
jgi:methionine aminopeptidase